MTNSTLNILIVEDDPIIAEDISSLLQEYNYNIEAVAHDAHVAYKYLESQKVDFAILDIYLGDGPTGIDIAEIIHDRYKIPYIFLTSFYDDDTLSKAKQFAPYGYLVKPFQDMSLLTTIKIAITNFKSSQKKGKISKIRIESKINASLTEQEFKVLLVLIQGDSYKQIAEQMQLSMNTIKYHASNIFRKCDINSRTELMNIALS